MAIIALAGCSHHQQHAFPPLQDDPAALAAREPDRLLVLVFTATWCGPCRAMERESWSDAAVQAWTRDHATLRAVDIDDDPATAGRYGVQGVPTLVAIDSQGEEVARSIGYLTSTDLLTFLEGAGSGISRLQQFEAQLAGAEPANAPAVNIEILREAARLQDWPRAALALDEAWAARDRLDPEDRFRLIASATRIGPEAGLASDALRRSRRDLGDPDPAAGTDPDTAVEWIHLSLALHEPDAVASWYAAAPDEPTRRGALRRSYLTLWSAFVDAQRPDDLIRLFTGDDPVGYTNASMQIEIIRLPGAPRISRNALLRTTTLPRLVDLYGACVVTGRTEQAADVRLAIERRFAAATVRAELDGAAARWRSAPPH